MLEGDLDVVKIKKEMSAMKALFEELGKLAAKGDVVTVGACRGA